MISVLDKKLRLLDESLSKVIAKLDVADSEILTYKPGPEKWNAVQILAHLQQSETASVAYMNKKLPAIDDQLKTGFKESYRSFLLKMFLYSPLKFKAPAAFANMPEDLVYKEIRDQYFQTRRELREVLSLLNEEHLDRAIMKHPRIGRINAPQTLDFIASHFEHHRKQIDDRLLRGRKI
ncbi:MAG: DinB family protein [Cyclobacteriaceae bacterium]